MGATAHSRERMLTAAAAKSRRSSPSVAAVARTGTTTGWRFRVAREAGRTSALGVRTAQRDRCIVANVFKRALQRREACLGAGSN